MPRPATALACLLCLVLSLSAHARTWSVGEDTIEAALVSCRGGIVILEEDSGGKSLHSLENFSAADRAYILERFPEGGESSEPATRQRPPTATIDRDTEGDKDKGGRIRIGGGHPGLHGYDVGEEPPPLSFRKQGKNEWVKLEDYHGKFVLVTFWASWHRGSLAEQARIVPVYNRYKDSGFQVLGVSLDSSHRQLNRIEERLGITWPQRLDAQRRIFKNWGGSALPTSVLLDPSGFGLAENVPAAALEPLLRQSMGLEK